MIYATKGAEIIEATISVYKESFQELYGYEPKGDEMLKELEVILKEKQAQDFRSRFGTLMPQDIITAMNIIKGEPQQDKDGNKAPQNSVQFAKDSGKAHETRTGYIFPANKNTKVDRK